MGVGGVDSDNKFSIHLPRISCILEMDSNWALQVAAGEYLISCVGS